ncbi:acyl-coenzyme A synthetase ACSM5, mitochondrial-like isoform X1 [Manis javanica]|uniref:acyl-coenzyme A synthetase ACSM5, mitochondrial-like isoform X1 n=1 Tax=Manis javanica TaxID=9974 RepID=UPI00187A5EEB|nr:acyl-coenzyme A synthetase ACSM5, mitochondrial-like isoform X1 [Manis javanica]
MHIPGLQPQAQLLGGPACRYPDTVLSSPCQIVGNGGNILPAGEVGSIAICVRPSWPFCFSNCYLLCEGEEGMSKSLFFSSSYWIVPAEVESALAEHPVVLESAVVSSPDPTTGEVVKAFIGLSPAYSSHDPEKLTQELQEHVKRVTAPYKYPGKSQGDLCFRTAKDSFWKDPEE